MRKMTDRFAFLTRERTLLAFSVLLLCCAPLQAATATTTIFQASSNVISVGQVETLTAIVNAATLVGRGQVIFEDERTPGACAPATASPTACRILGAKQLAGGQVP